MSFGLFVSIVCSAFGLLICWASLVTCELLGAGGVSVMGLCCSSCVTVALFVVRWRLSTRVTFGRMVGAVVGMRGVGSVVLVVDCCFCMKVSICGLYCVG